ncbi:MAG: DUF3445 domain-containing protein [Paracoccaceae bacterium]|nr:DUF3445 domain-containing protein [Paracoccaceae bacterium]
MVPILQKSLPYDVRVKQPLPAIQPLRRPEWLQIDDAYDKQIAERERLIRGQREDVLEMSEGARPAAEELLDQVLEDLSQRDDFTVTGPLVRRPDGVWVEIDRGDPLGVLARLVQEDLCLLEKTGDEHVLTGAVLCFPASWTLAEKFMRPLVLIHEPVESYDENIARRVQRLFDGVKPTRPLWRYNLLHYTDPTLHQPRPEVAPRARSDGKDLGYIRSERQCVLRLPKTGAVVFSIHTYVLKDSDVQL